MYHPALAPFGSQRSGDPKSIYLFPNLCIFLFVYTPRGMLASCASHDGHPMPCIGLGPPACFGDPGCNFQHSLVTLANTILGPGEYTHLPWYTCVYVQAHGPFFILIVVNVMHPYHKSRASFLSNAATPYRARAKSSAIGKILRRVLACMLMLLALCVVCVVSSVFCMFALLLSHCVALFQVWWIIQIYFLEERYALMT